ncbi:hypothetical protein D3C77_715920 [compost metagenome]
MSHIDMGYLRQRDLSLFVGWVAEGERLRIDLIQLPNEVLNCRQLSVILPGIKFLQQRPQLCPQRHQAMTVILLGRPISHTPGQREDHLELKLKSLTV